MTRSGATPQTRPSTVSLRTMLAPGAKALKPPAALHRH